MDNAELSVFHLHPLQRCNLRCRHCYSNSSPHGRQMLALEQSIDAVTSAARWGYGALAVAGGEPLLYPGLATLLEHAASIGMDTSVVTNGLLLRTQSEIGLLKHADTVTVSIDGLAIQHDQMRGRGGAFAGAANAVRRLADAGSTTWVTCGITTANMDDIEEISSHAACWGAQGITFHLVEPAGRAAALPEETFLRADERVLLYVSVALLAAAHRKTINIRLDLLHRDTVLRQPSLLYATPSEPGSVHSPAHTLRVLVMYPDGTLLPVCHGFNGRFAVGRCGENPEHMWNRFFEHILPLLMALGREAWAELRSVETLRVLNPGDWLAERSHTWQPTPRQSQTEIAHGYPCPLTCVTQEA